MATGPALSVGAIAVGLGLISERQLAEAIEAQKKEAESGRPQLLGRLLVSRSYLSEEALAKVLAEQKRLQAEREKEGFSRIGIGDAYRMLGALQDALASYKGVLDEFGDSLKVTAAARLRISDVEREIST